MTENQKTTIPAGLMFDYASAYLDGKPAFEMHSGKDSMSQPGTATITLDKGGAVKKITWRPEK